jgi:hypothetical protein
MGKIEIKSWFQGLHEFPGHAAITDSILGKLGNLSPYRSFNEGRRPSKAEKLCWVGGEGPLGLPLLLKAPTTDGVPRLASNHDPLNLSLTGS